jgi:hypothetical protein
MTHELLLQKTMGLFDNSDKWDSFLELTSIQNAIISRWDSKLKDEIRAQIKYEDPWELDATARQWYLKDFGPNSLSIWLEGEYFSLWADDTFFDVKLIHEELKKRKFKPISDCVINKDIPFDGRGYLFRERGRFQFYSINDNHFDFNHLAWFAGNKTDEYVKQIQNKLKPFFETNTTNLMVELNSLAKR